MTERDRTGGWARLAVLIVAPALLLALVPVTGGTAAQAKEGWFGGARPGASSVSYGEIPPAGERANPETIYLHLSCTNGGHAVGFFVSETGRALRPGRRVQVTVVAGRVTQRVRGKTLANELAGAPSLQFRVPMRARLLGAINPRNTLTIASGRWRKSFSLRSLGGQFNTVLATCRKMKLKLKKG